MDMTNTASAGTVRIGDREVRRLGFGAMRITGPGVWGPPSDPAAAVALLRFIAEHVDLVDTADSYGPNVSEELLAQALAPYRAGLVIATKGGLLRPGRDAWVPDCSSAHLRAACEASLRRLRVEAIEVYQLHAIDRRVPLAESVGTLAELRAEGKIRHVGLSNVTVAHYEQAKRLVPIVSIQNRYSLTDRRSDDVIDACERDGIPFLPWYPLDAGALAKPTGTLARIAASHGATPVQIVLAWLLRRSPIVLPIPGTSSLAHAQENLRAVAIRLSDEEFAALAAYR